MSWKTRVIGWLGSATAKQAWPRVKRAASAAWRAFREAPVAPTPEPKEPQA